MNEPDIAGERRPTTSKKFELPKRAANTGSQSSTSSLGPMLPDVSRVSGFGESFGDTFFGGTIGSGNDSSAPTLDLAASSSRSPSQVSNKTAPERDLQHQPSLGFTSAVHQAFDRAEEQVPPTPSSAAASTIGRSASGGTSAISPIISRGPSAATDRLPGIEDVSTSIIAEEPESRSRPRSSGSPTTPRQIERKLSPAEGTARKPADTPPPSFIPGHRRNMSTPSPDNSPARTPAVEATRQLRQPQEVEIAATTPTEPSFSTNGGSQYSEIGHEEGSAVTSSSPTKAFQTVSPISASQYSRSRTDSSSSNRVRNLADKFESNSRPGSVHSTTPRASLLGSGLQKKDEFAPPRPIADRTESFRPQLPGGWESSASIAPAAGARGLETTGGRQQPGEMIASSGPHSIRYNNVPNDDAATSYNGQQSSTSQIKDASAEAFTAAAAAGTALAGAFAAAAGMEQHGNSTGSTSYEQGLQGKFEDPEVITRARNSSVNTVVHPEASRPSVSSLTEDEMPGATPTPLPNLRQSTTVSAENPEYFPSPLSVHQGASKRANQIEDSTSGKQQPKLPMLNTDSKSHQYESDRLRKEIVRELTPMSTSEPTTAETDYSNNQDISRLSTGASVSRPGHESGVLPREYESYWNDANSDDEVSEVSPEPTRLEHATTADRQQGASLVSEPLQPMEKMQPLPLAPVSQAEVPQERPHTLPHRFSWEQPLQDLSPEPAPLQEPIAQSATPTSDFLKSAIYPEGRSFQPQDGHSDINDLSSMPTQPISAANEVPHAPQKDLSVSDITDTESRQRTSLETQKELPEFSSGLELAQSRSERAPEESLVSNRDGKAMELVQPSPASHNEQRRESETPLSEPPRPEALATTTSDPFSPSTGPASPPKIPAFREIVALKTPSERIRSYNEARHQFVGLKVGLDDWIAQTINALPEHADLLTTSGRRPNFQGHKTSPSRSKLGGLLPGGGQPGQQPYLQQYLNASPQSSVANAATQSGTMGGSSPSAGSGGKTSSQQVQAKGKDLLHSAGVFGGKANVAAKGLFSKGKSKFRAASGAEKV